MTSPARPGGSVLVEASRVVGLELIDRGFELFTALQLSRSPVRALTSGHADLEAH